MVRQLERKIQAWAEKDPLVRALVVIDSYAYEKHTADRWSDLDLILFVSDPRLLIRDSAWLNRFGEIWLTHLQVSGSGMPEWFVIYDGGLKVDFLLLEAKKTLSEALNGPPLGVVTRRGVRVLVDKGEPVPAGPPVHDFFAQSLPDAEALEGAVKSFFLSAFRAAGFLRRGDLWRARKIMDVTLRQQIVDMMAWQARAKNGPGLDTWHDGRYMEEWADPRIVDQLPVFFAPYEIAASARALGEMISLYLWMVKETAVLLPQPFPLDFQDRVRDWIESELKKIV